ncbi:MAG: hypothetical protein JOZ46_07075 [Candidatus Dormibacteraeota bacterium]|nr:hypothetical protein [Candidatus Dormibacteraeota bacterium]MBV9525559.1 hypothetical protein [Candidatus Dormibacteraeota bacterium]
MTLLSRSRIRRGSLLTVACVAALVAGSTIKASAINAPPPKDCDTPNQSNGVGVLEQPQSINSQTNQPYLTKTLSNTVSQPGSTTYQFTLQTTRTTTSDSGSGAAVSYTSTTLTDTSKSWTTNQWANATVSVNAGAETGTVASNTNNTLTLTGAWTGGTPAAQSPYSITFFSELLDCAWDVTTGGNQTTAQYATQQNAPTFDANNRLTISLDVNNSDAVCDRVELKGTTPSGTPFTDYSNLVGSPNGTQCSPSSVTPEVPTAVLVIVIGGGAIGAFVYVQRRRGRRVSAV